MEKLYVGLDVGTNSVGWAVTDEDYNVLRLRGKKAWGSRIFSEANSKVDTRMIRSNRRRVARRRYRIQLLQELFAEEMKNVDSTFFARLDNSMYHLEDKNIEFRNLIFKTKVEEKEFYELYPTIWHLRKALLNGENYACSKLQHVYLALHHILKYRGNFLLEGTFSTNVLDENLLVELNEFMKSKYAQETGVEFSGDLFISSKTDKLKEILLDSNLRKTTKQKKIQELFECCDKVVEKYIKMFAVIVSGGTYKLSNLGMESDENISFEGNFDDTKDTISNELQGDFILVDIAKKIYDFIVLKELLGDEISISNVMSHVYDEHKKDLRILKNVIVDIDTNLKSDKRLYDVMFKGEHDKNYASLVGNNSHKRIKPEEFNAYIYKLLKENATYVSEDYIKDYEYLIEKSSNKKLLKLISHYSTSVIPHQLHLMELEKIIDNASVKFPFLTNIKEKLILLFKYRIHYSFGPLDDRSEFSNVVRNSNERITPWNIKEVINESATKEKFMRKLTNSCSYLLSEKVMPKASLSFEKFVILDKLNPMKVNGEPLIGSEKQEVLKYLLSRSKTTINQLRLFLSRRYNVKSNDILISNIKEDVIFEATSHSHLSKTFDVDCEHDKLEYFIYLATVYADDKKTLKEVLLSDFTELTESQVKSILNIQTKKWAPLSKTFLEEITYFDEETGEQVSILSHMETSNDNLQMTLYHKKYNFVKLVDDFNRDVKGDKSSEQVIEDLLDQTPSKFRRSINQTLLILNDIEKASKKTPDKIFIEVTRDDDEKKKNIESVSRVNEVFDFINKLIKNVSTAEDGNRLKEEFELIEKSKLKNKHVYLYFKQQGRDMYTNKVIDLKDVIFSNKYDLDHIIPQSLIKDDSLDNLVLVDREYNQRIKSDKFPIPSSIKTQEVINLWYQLRNNNSISEKKFSNLMRTSEITLEEVESFVAHQINVVNYSNVVLKNILEIKYPNSTIVFSKAKYPSFIRKYLEIAKNRDVNDTHHAVDAYLNIFAGNVLSTTYSNPKKIYEEKQEDSSKTFNMENTLKNKLCKNDKSGIKYSEKIKRTSLRRDIIVTFKHDFNSGAFYNATIEKASNSDALIPIHSNTSLINTKKYGGYSGLNQSYIMAVQYEENGKKYKKLLRVPVLFEKTYKDDAELLTKVVNNENATNLKLLRKIYLNQKIRYNGCEYLLYTNNATVNKYKMAYQNYVDNDYLIYLKLANKHIDNILDENASIQEISKNRKEEKMVISKEKNIEIFDSLINTAKKRIYDSCNYVVKLREIDRNVFAKLSIKDQINVINNIISTLSRTSEKSSFKISELNAPTNCLLRVTNNISGETITLIYESATGLFSHEVEI